MEFFNAVFLFYDTWFAEKCICVIGDNTSTNRRIERIADESLIRCTSQLLLLQVNAIVNSHRVLEDIIETVQNTMRVAKQLKNAALLRNVTD